MDAEPTDSRISELASTLDEVVTKFEYSHQIVEALVTDASDSDRQAIATAFSFMTSNDGEKGVYFKPTFVFNDGTSEPGALADIEDEVLEVWQSTAAIVTAPAARARLHDLLFVRRFGDVGEHAAMAIDAYSSVWGQSERPGLDDADALQRALTLCALTSSPRVGEIRTAMLDAAERCLSESDHKPGIFHRLVEPLITEKQLNRVDQVLHAARQRYEGDVHRVEGILELQRRRVGSDDERKALDRELIGLLLEHANACEPLVASHFRERAAKLARERGLRELADKAVREMQNGAPPELTKFGAEITLDEGQVEEMIESMIGDDWWSSVLRLLGHGPPSGQCATNVKSADEVGRTSVFMSVSPTTHLGLDGLPRYTSTTDKEKADDRLTTVESQHIAIVGRLHVAALHRSGERFAPTSEEIAAHFASIGHEQDVALAIGLVIQRFQTGDDTGALFVALPLIERMARSLLIEIDAPVYRVQRERNPATYAGLGVLLPALTDHGLDESWSRYLRTLLASPNGMNLRNEALHGFVVHSDALHAGLAIIALLFIAVNRPERPDGSELASESHTGPEDTFDRAASTPSDD